jgi:large subunit ribosomal protein L20
MPRVKRGKIAHKRRKNLLKNVKGFRWGRKNKFKAAKEALMKAWSYSYRDRKAKKREIRKMWNISINNACRKNNTTYRDFIYNLKQKNIELDRKILSRFAKEEPDTFKKIVEEVGK